MAESTRLDRLSALLEGLSPRVVLIPQTEALEFESGRFNHLYIHVLLHGRADVNVASTPIVHVEAPVLVVCSGEFGHVLKNVPGDASDRAISFDASFNGPASSLFMHEFSRPLIISLNTADESLARIVQLISSEVLQPRCGQPALMNRAGDILLIGLLRHLVANPVKAVGMFRGLADPRIARTLVAIHASPSQSWTLQTLAIEAGMSRTAFATQFRNVMNVSAGRYLGNLRLAIAQRLVESGHGLKKAAREAGYASTSTLSRAMNRLNHLSRAAPGELGRFNRA